MSLVKLPFVKINLYYIRPGKPIPEIDYFFLSRMDKLTYELHLEYMEEFYNEKDKSYVIPGKYTKCHYTTVRSAFDELLRTSLESENIKFYNQPTLTWTLKDITDPKILIEKEKEWWLSKDLYMNREDIKKGYIIRV